jgi:hypothetical protein
MTKIISIATICALAMLFSIGLGLILTIVLGWIIESEKFKEE